ncbi:hypothetical protein V2A60_001992 [Cordyceps javanica]|uniref:Uncharacterized protein n=1 Tax=Cordyceps javanica TaxID=43265 RepID=A0A545VGW7_9HYPO|nr:hypothetical protein IF1G_00893 [Cordyceps javanica]
MATLSASATRSPKLAKVPEATRKRGLGDNVLSSRSSQCLFPCAQNQAPRASRAGPGFGGSPSPASVPDQVHADRLQEAKQSAMPGNAVDKKRISDASRIDPRRGLNLSELSAHARDGSERALKMTPTLYRQCTLRLFRSLIGLRCSAPNSSRLPCSLP